MKKIFISLVLFCLCATSMNAQITKGESSSKQVRTGNRAQAGNFGIYFGATSDMFKNITDGGTNFKSIPLINLKYMYSDRLEYRMGIEWWDKSEGGKSNGVEATKTESSFLFYPGVAYHFSKSNLLDVYVGGELPFGFGSKGHDDGDKDYSSSNFRIGVGAFIGLQAYVANLPVAIGMEYGVNSLYNKVTDGTLTQDGLTIEGYSEDLDSHTWKIGHQVRFTLSYYFNL